MQSYLHVFIIRTAPSNINSGSSGINLRIERIESFIINALYGHVADALREIPQGVQTTSTLSELTLSL